MAEAAATIERGAEPAAPEIQRVRRDDFPSVALGLPPEAAPAVSAATEPQASTPEPASSSTPAPAPAAVAAADAPPEEPKTENAEDAAASTLNLRTANKDDLRKDPTVAAIVGELLDKKLAEERATLATQRAEAERLATASKQQAEFDALLEKSEDESDPIGAEQARVQLAQHVRTQRIREKVQADALPAAAQQASQRILSQLGQQYEKAYAALGMDEATLQAVRHDRFNDAGEWLVAFAKAEAARAVAEARSKWEKDELHPLAEARAAQATADLRTRMPNPDLTEGAGAGAASLRFTSVDAVHAAHAAGQLSTSQARWHLSQLGARRRAA